MSKLGDDMGSESDWFSSPGNPSKGILGGDNSHDLGKFASPGNESVGSVMDHDYGRQGDKPLFKVEGAPDRHEVKSMFRGGD